MMMLFEETTVPGTVLPVQGMKDHLRLGSGFSDDGMQDNLVEGYLRAAISTIEGRIGKVLLARRFRLVLEDWRGPGEQTLPVAPVTAIVSITLFDKAGAQTVLAASSYRLVADFQRPKVVPVGVLLPGVPSDGRAEVRFDAGYSATWGGVPADLAQAVFLLAAEFHERRHDGEGRVAGLPQTVVALIERWRTVRVLGGGAS